MMCLQIEQAWQLHQAVQCLQPRLEQDPSDSEWHRLASHVRQQWPLPSHPAESEDSRFGASVSLILQLMGYQALQLYEAGDGLHEVDIALLPQRDIPVKVAIELDGQTHYLYEDCKLQYSPEPARR